MSKEAVERAMSAMGDVDWLYSPKNWENDRVLGGPISSQEYDRQGERVFLGKGSLDYFYRNGHLVYNHHSDPSDAVKILGDCLNLGTDSTGKTFALFGVYDGTESVDKWWEGEAKEKAEEAGFSIGGKVRDFKRLSEEGVIDNPELLETSWTPSPANEQSYLYYINRFAKNLITKSADSQMGFEFGPSKRQIERTFPDVFRADPGLDINIPQLRKQYPCVDGYMRGAMEMDLKRSEAEVFCKELLRDIKRKVVNNMPKNETVGKEEQPPAQPPQQPEQAGNAAMEQLSALGQKLDQVLVLLNKPDPGVVETPPDEAPGAAPPAEKEETNEPENEPEKDPEPEREQERGDRKKSGVKKDANSVSELEEKVRGAFNSKFSSDTEKDDYWMVTIGTNECIVEGDGENLKVGFQMDKEGNIEFDSRSDWKPVKQTWVEKGTDIPEGSAVSGTDEEASDNPDVTPDPGGEGEKPDTQESDLNATGVKPEDEGDNPDVPEEADEEGDVGQEDEEQQTGDTEIENKPLENTDEQGEKNIPPRTAVDKKQPRFMLKNVPPGRVRDMAEKKGLVRVDNRPLSKHGKPAPYDAPYANGGKTKHDPISDDKDSRSRLQKMKDVLRKSNPIRKGPSKTPLLDKMKENKQIKVKK